MFNAQPTGTVVSRRPRDESAETGVRADTLGWKLQIKLAISSNHCILTPGQPVPAVTLSRQAPNNVVTGVPISKSLVWLELEKDINNNNNDNNNDDDDADNNNNSNNSNNNDNRIERRNSRFFFYSLLTANCLQHIRSSGPGAILCKSRATHRAFITCNLQCDTWFEGTVQLLSLPELKRHLFELY